MRDQPPPTPAAAVRRSLRMRSSTSSFVHSPQRFARVASRLFTACLRPILRQKRKMHSTPMSTNTNVVRIRTTRALDPHDASSAAPMSPDDIEAALAALGAPQWLINVVRSSPPEFGASVLAELEKKPQGNGGTTPVAARGLSGRELEILNRQMGVVPVKAASQLLPHVDAKGDFVFPSTTPTVVRQLAAAGVRAGVRAGA